MPAKRLKILFISSWYPNKIKPLNGIFVKRHAMAIALDCDVSVIFICSDKTNSIEESTEDGVYTIRGYYKEPTLRIPLYYSMVKLIRYFLMWKKALSIYKKNKGKPDLINANIVYPISIIATMLKFMWKVPYVITEHWTGYFPEDGRYRGFIWKTLSEIAVANAGAVITPSFKLSGMMQSLGLKNNYFTIPNVVDTELFTIKPAQSTNGAINFIHISSLDDEQKNISGILRTFKKFYAKHSLSKLTIVWDEEEKELLEKIKEPFSKDEGVFLTGKKEGLELACFIQNADAFILFSNFENLPVVMLESFCCGVPVISTRVGEVPEYINEKNGIIIEPKNEEQLLDAMEKVFINSAKYISTEIRRMIVDKVSPSSVSGQFSKVYTVVVNGSIL